MGKCQQCDSHVKGRLRAAPGVGKKAGQGRLRLTRADSATSRAPGPRPLRLSHRPAHVEQRRSVLRCAEHPDPGRTGRQRTAVRRSGDHLGALDVSTGVWGGDQPPGGARGPHLGFNLEGGPVTSQNLAPFHLGFGLGDVSIPCKTVGPKVIPLPDIDYNKEVRRDEEECPPMTTSFWVALSS